MCGINGFLATRAMSRGSLHEIAEAMSHEQLHRGPDDSGVWVDEEAGVALGFRRLAILDLSVEGHQPMLSRTGRFSIVFNGEIYNYVDIRRELEGGGGYRWRGHSDTEVLLAAIERWGVAGAIERTNGMFALAVWDNQTRSLHLARDRVGEKPLYYGWCGGAFLFGSELRTLRAHPAWDGEIDRRVLALYMRYAYVPGPYSIYRDVFKLPPATLLTLPWGDGSSGRAPHLQQYWSAQRVAREGVASRATRDIGEAVDGLDRELRAAVRLRMHADVPVGAFLSGGVDSSTIAALMQAESSRPVRTFSIGFTDSGYDEASHAREVAAHLGTDHTEVYLKDVEARETIPSLARIYSEPFADSSQIPTLLVSATARKHVTVALSGDGGDELFGGYNRYVWGRRVLRGAAVPTPMRRALAGAIGSISPRRWDGMYDRISALLPGRARASHPGDSIHKLARAIGARDSAELYDRLTTHWDNAGAIVLGSGTGPRLANGVDALPAPADAIDSMMYQDLVTYLPDDILVKVDRASMAVSLEARVPFLDPNVIAFAWSLPASLKFRDGKGKWIVRELLDRYVPRTLTDRPKMGFAVPIDSWLRGPLREWAAALLDESRLVREGYLDPRPIMKQWQEHLSGSRNRQHPLWVVLMFQAWLDAEQG